MSLSFGIVLGYHKISGCVDKYETAKEIKKAPFIVVCIISNAWWNKYTRQFGHDKQAVTNQGNLQGTDMWK